RVVPAVRQRTQRPLARQVQALVDDSGDAEAQETVGSADATQDFERARSNDNRFNPEAFSRLTSSLLAVKSAPPVIVFDTLERVSLYYQQDLLDLIAKLAGVHGNYPALRLILTGRYDL